MFPFPWKNIPSSQRPISSINFSVFLGEIIRLILILRKNVFRTYLVSISKLERNVTSGPPFGGGGGGFPLCCFGEEGGSAAGVSLGFEELDEPHLSTLPVLRLYYAFDHPSWTSTAALCF